MKMRYYFSMIFMLVTITNVLLPAVTLIDEHQNGAIISITPFKPHDYATLDATDKRTLTPAAYDAMTKWLDMADAEFFTITYLSAGIKVKAILGKPKNLTAPSPLIIYNRGGYGEYSKITLPVMQNQWHDLIRNGYTVIGSQYRGNDGGDGVDECGGNDVLDVLNLIPLARQFDYIDIDRVYIIGYSRGGMMSYMALRQFASMHEIKAAAILAGISDAYLFVQQRPELRDLFMHAVPSIHNNMANELYKRSAVRWAHEIKTPLLLFHGSQDNIVSLDHSVSLAHILKEHNKKHQLIIYDNEDHSFKNNLNAVNQSILQWFAQHQ